MNATPVKEIQPLSITTKKVILFTIVVVGFVSAFAYHWYQSVILERVYPRDTFLCLPTDRFMDFFNNVFAFREYKFNTIIFPTQNIFFWLFSFLTDFNALVVYLGIFVLYFFYFVLRNFRDPGVSRLRSGFESLLIGGLSYPFMFAIDRGNIESYMFIAISLFATFYVSQRKYLASLFLAAAIGAKVFPGVFLVFYLREKAFKPLFAIVLFLAAISLTLLIPADPMLTVNRANGFFTMYLQTYVIDDAGYAFGHSFFGLLKTTMYYISDLDSGNYKAWFLQSAADILKVYSYLTFLIYGLVAWAILNSEEMPTWKQFSILTILFCFLPHVSADYKLMHLFTPLALFMRDQKGSRIDWWYAVLFGLLLIPKAYYISDYGASVSVVITPILLALLLVSIFIDEYRSDRLRFFTLKYFRSYLPVRSESPKVAG